MLPTKFEQERVFWSRNSCITLEIICDLRYPKKLFVLLSMKNNNIEMYNLNNLGSCFNFMAWHISTVFKKLFWRKVCLFLCLSMKHEMVKVIILSIYLQQKFSLCVCSDLIDDWRIGRLLSLRNADDKKKKRLKIYWGYFQKSFICFHKILGSWKLQGLLKSLKTRLYVGIGSFWWSFNGCVLMKGME